MASILGILSWSPSRGRQLHAIKETYGEILVANNKSANNHLSKFGNWIPFPNKEEPSDETAALANSKLRRDLECEGTQLSLIQIPDSGIFIVINH